MTRPIRVTDVAKVLQREPKDVRDRLNFFFGQKDYISQSRIDPTLAVAFVVSEERLEKE